MASSVSNPADVVNLALGRIGHPAIGNLYDGSEAAQKALDIYGETRDEVLRLEDWPFATRDAALVLLKSAPAGGYGVIGWTTAEPPPPWKYEYAYPDGCIRVLNVMQAPSFPALDPQPVLYKVTNDSALVPPARVVLAQITGAIAVFTARITDMTLWDPLFVDAVVEALAKRLTVALAAGGAMDLLKGEAQQQEKILAAAAARAES